MLARSATMASCSCLLLSPIPPKKLSSVPPRFLSSRPPSSSSSSSLPRRNCSSLKAVSLSSLPELQSTLVDLFQASPPTWKSAIGSNLIIFVLGYPLLASGLSISGIGAAFLLGSVTWRAYSSSGFLLVASYFVLGTFVTKLKMAQKEAMGVAEKRGGRRGPGSVIGSGTAGIICALLTIFGVGGQTFAGLWQLGFVASYCTKLSDTASSEIGKAYGKTAYLVTNFQVVPRGTEGAVSVEGTIAGFIASILLSTVAYFLGKVDVPGAVICVIASQIANFVESYIGAVLQDKEDFQWLNNDAVNVINISTGTILAVLMQQALWNL